MKLRDTRDLSAAKIKLELSEDRGAIETTAKLLGGRAWHTTIGGTAYDLRGFWDILGDTAPAPVRVTDAQHPDGVTMTRPEYRAYRAQLKQARRESICLPS